MCVCVCVCVCESQSFSHVQLFATARTVAHQAPLSMEFSRQETGVGNHSLPNPGIEHGSPALQEDTLPLAPNSSYPDFILTPQNS